MTQALDGVVAKRGRPKSLRLDHGTELTSRVLDAWAHAHGITLGFLRPGKPVENAFVESFNGRLRDESPNAIWFTLLEDARVRIETWRRDDHDVRRHLAL